MTVPSLLDDLEQTEFWFGQDRRPYRIEDMEQSHRVNVLAFLRRRVDSLATSRLWREFVEMEDAPDDVLKQWSNQLESSPLDWLNSRPLVRALEAAVAAHDIRSGDVVDGEVVPPRAEIQGACGDLVGHDEARRWPS
jgi:hypothetical protein